MKIDLDQEFLDDFAEKLIKFHEGCAGQTSEEIEYFAKGYTTGMLDLVFGEMVITSVELKNPTKEGE